jgi:hypothetical protein
MDAENDVSSAPVDERPARFQFDLGEMLVVVLLAGLSIGLFTFVLRNNPATGALVGLAVIGGATAFAFVSTERRTVDRWIHLGGSLLAAGILGLILSGALMRESRGEIPGVALTKALMEAQEIYRRTDYDGDGTLEYAQSLGALSMDSKGEQICVIDSATAAADADDPAAVPKVGYLIKFLAGRKEAGKVIEFIDADGNQTRGHACVSVPAVYGQSGTIAYMIDERGTIYQKDLGPKGLAIVRAMKYFDISTGWTLTE